MNENKLKAYLGFAIKSRNIIFGYDKLFETKKLPYLVLICSTLNEKNSAKCISFCTEKNINVIKLTDLIISDLIGRDNCKVISIIDDNFANIISRELELINGK